MPNALQTCIAGLGLIIVCAPTTRVANADSSQQEKQKPHDALWPQISYSIAVGSSEGAMGHIWLGSGAHNRRGQYVLLGADFDFRNGGNEAWLAGRFGQGYFSRRALVPKAAMYLIGGVRLGKRTYDSPRHSSAASGTTEAMSAEQTEETTERAAAEPTWRIGFGISVPAAIQLACIGIPTMIEAGVDTEPTLSTARGFVRAGWNF